MDEKLFKDLLVSLEEAGDIAHGLRKAARRTLLVAPPKPQPVDAKAVREKTGLTQSEFAIVMNVSVKTLQNWEQSRRAPTGPAAALLKIVFNAPELALRALNR